MRPHRAHARRSSRMVSSVMRADASRANRSSSRRARNTRMHSSRMCRVPTTAGAAYFYPHPSPDRVMCLIRFRVDSRRDLRYRQVLAYQKWSTRSYRTTSDGRDGAGGASPRRYRMVSDAWDAIVSAADEADSSSTAAAVGDVANRSASHHTTDDCWRDPIGSDRRLPSLRRDSLNSNSNDCKGMCHRYRRCRHRHRPYHRDRVNMKSYRARNRTSVAYCRRTADRSTVSATRWNDVVGGVVRWKHAASSAVSTSVASDRSVRACDRCDVGAWDHPSHSDRADGASDADERTSPTKAGRRIEHDRYDSREIGCEKEERIVEVGVAGDVDRIVVAVAAVGPTRTVVDWAAMCVVDLRAVRSAVRCRSLRAASAIRVRDRTSVGFESWS